MEHNIEKSKSIEKVNHNILIFCRAENDKFSTFKKVRYIFRVYKSILGVNIKMWGIIHVHKILINMRGINCENVNCGNGLVPHLYSVH